VIKKAFLVGINDYNPEGLGGPDLNGCVNDVEDMKRTLIDVFKFSEGNIKILTDKRATKSGILKGLEWLIKGVKKRDVLVFYYSGHGSRVIDRNGDETEDHLDEALCPYDVDYVDYSYYTHILDDEMARIFSELPEGINLEIILDCCHSGTATREMQKTKCLESSVFLKFLSLKRKTIKEVVVIPLKHVLWSACRENEIAQEIIVEDKARGIFTYYFCKILREIKGKKIRKRIYRMLKRAIKHHYNHIHGSYKYNIQVPQLEGPRKKINKKIFS